MLENRPYLPVLTAAKPKTVQIMNSPPKTESRHRNTAIFRLCKLQIFQELLKALQKEKE
jgi:hypothetical protein